uniref:Uncharacterized protein n=1 Tax=Globisporangium ultimum (strain ATCC 200006 / CBS 805.95 / DAOM BR144) TaxID=431595 RepID=K3X7N8_GLOUD
MVEVSPVELKSIDATKWSEPVKPQTAALAKSTSSSGSAYKVLKRRGLREKLYSVDSLADTEPEDFDDDEEEEDETESEGSESGDVIAHHPVEEVIVEEETPEVEYEAETVVLEQQSEAVCAAEKDMSPVPVLEEKATAPMLPEMQSEDAACSAGTKKLETIQDSDDSDDTESEDDGDACSTIDEDNFVPVQVVAQDKLDIFGQSLEEKAKQHEPFLFPPPYFPGDLDEYESDIYETLLRREKIHHVVTDYFHSQPHVTIVMRSMLIDWLVEVHNHFNLQPDTLYLTVNYIDRFLASVPVKRENFQLVALTALLIASKFEEIHPVDIEDLVYICERSYTAKQIVQFEKEMLQAFKFHLVVPTCSGFLEYYNDKLESELEVAQLANFFSEQTLLDFHLCAKYVPSVIAASSVLLAQIYYEKQKPSLSWVLGFEEITGYYAKDIWCCVHDLSDMLASLSFDLVAVRTKFGSDRFGKVSKVPHMNIAGMNIEDLV